MQFSSAWEKLCWSQHLENGRNFNCNSHDIICITTRCFATRSMRLEIYYLSKKCRKRKVRRRICFDCPLLREFQFSHMLLLNWTAGSKVGKSLSDHHHNLLEVKIDALLGLQLFSAYSLFYLHRKAPGKVPWNWLALVSRLHDTSILEVEREEAREAGRKKKSPILMGSNADRKRRENCPPYRNLKYFQLD